MTIRSEIANEGHMFPGAIGYKRRSDIKEVNIIMFRVLTLEHI